MPEPDAAARAVANATSPPVASPRGGETFRSLRGRNFRLFYVGMLVSQAGTWMQRVAVVWVVLRLTDSGVALGLVSAAQFLPVLLLGIWGGVLADRVDRHRFMIATQIALTLVAAGFSVLSVLHRLGLGPIAVLCVAYGVFTALDNPVRRALTGDLVPPGDVANAVSLVSALITGTRIIGPAMAGALITSVGVQWCFVVNTVSYAAVIWALLRIDRSAIRPSPRLARAPGQLRAGLAHVWHTPRLRRVIVLLAVIGTLAFEYEVTLPLLGARTFGAGAGGFTLLYSLMSVGCVAGALLLARRDDVDAPFLLRGAWGLTVATVALTFAPNLALGAVAAVGVGATNILLLSGGHTFMQLHVEPEFRGRALALTLVVFAGSTPIGGPIAGWVAEHGGARAGVGLGAVAAAGVALWAGLAERAERAPVPA